MCVCDFISGMENIAAEDAELWELTNPDELHVPHSYKGPTLSLPLNMNQIESLIEAFKKKQVNNN